MKCFLSSDWNSFRSRIQLEPHELLHCSRYKPDLALFSDKDVTAFSVNSLSYY